MMGDEEYIPFKEIPSEVQFADFRMFYYCKTKMEWLPHEHLTHINLERVDYMTCLNGIYSIYMAGIEISRPLYGKFISYPAYLPMSMRV